MNFVFRHCTHYWPAMLLGDSKCAHCCHIESMESAISEITILIRQ